MAKVKCRMWDEENNLMIDGDSLAFEEYAPVINLLGYKTVMEFTGLLDTRGIEVYEGDIIKIPCDTNADFHGKFTLNEIVKVNGQWVSSYLTSETGVKLPPGYTRGFLLDHYEFSPKLFLWSEDYRANTEVEVVGNIYQKPELLLSK